MLVIFSGNCGKPRDGGGKFIPEAHGVPDGSVKEKLSRISWVRSNYVKDPLFELGLLK